MVVVRTVLYSKLRRAMVALPLPLTNQAQCASQPLEYAFNIPSSTLSASPCFSTSACSGFFSASGFASKYDSKS
eukprot:COSAG04_NODE_1775_length_5604_cov_1.976022_4_plen_74_part_00